MDSQCSNLHANNLHLNLERTTKILTNFIKMEVEKSGFKKVVLGLSGGIDSAVVAHLAVKALGAENVFVIMMPYKTSTSNSLEDAMKIINDLKIKYKKVEITNMIDAYINMTPNMTNLRKGNKMSRERMSILYDTSAAKNSLVLGTSNKTELLLGYGTQWGDMASALNPIGDLYKTQIWEIAKYLKISEQIILKKPSADLWEGQSDEDDLGFTYYVADQILDLYIDQRYTVNKIKDMKFSNEIIDTILTTLKRVQYKRKLPVIAKISSRTIDNDFRYPRDWEL